MYKRQIDAYLRGATWEELILFALWAVGLNAGIVLLKALLHKRQEIEETRFKLCFEEKLRLHQMNYTLGDIMSNRVQEAQRGIEQAKMRGFQFETLIPRTQKLMPVSYTHLVQYRAYSLLHCFDGFCEDEYRQEDRG